MTRILKAIPTTYRGIKFRSKLEARYAQAFDRLGIVWEYEGHGFAFKDGTSYCPDFYFPEIDTYFEVKGAMDPESAHKIDLLAREARQTVVVGGPDGLLTMYSGKPDRTNGGDTTPAKCRECGKVFFLDNDGRWDCHACRAYDGDHHFSTIGCFGDSIFDCVGL